MLLWGLKSVVMHPVLFLCLPVQGRMIIATAITISTQLSPRTRLSAVGREISVPCLTVSNLAIASIV